jgi:hypothetical protein
MGLVFVSRLVAFCPALQLCCSRGAPVNDAALSAHADRTFEPHGAPVYLLVADDAASVIIPVVQRNKPFRALVRHQLTAF